MSQRTNTESMFEGATPSDAELEKTHDELFSKSEVPEEIGGQSHENYRPHREPPTRKGGTKRNYRTSAIIEGYQEKRTFSSNEGYEMKLYSKDNSGKEILAFTIVACDVEPGIRSTQVFRGNKEDGLRVAEFTGGEYITINREKSMVASATLEPANSFNSWEPDYRRK